MQERVAGVGNARGPGRSADTEGCEPEGESIGEGAALYATPIAVCGSITVFGGGRVSVGFTGISDGKVLRRALETETDTSLLVATFGSNAKRVATTFTGTKVLSHLPNI